MSSNQRYERADRPMERHTLSCLQGVDGTRAMHLLPQQAQAARPLLTIMTAERKRYETAMRALADTTIMPQHKAASRTAEGAAT